MNAFSKQKELIVFLLVLIVCLYHFSLHYPVVLDDAFIYFRVVENFIALGSLEFNLSDGSFIATSPLWTFLLIILKTLFTSISLETLSKVTWLFLLSGAAWFAYQAFTPYLQKWSVFIPVPLFMSPMLGSMLGNEIALLFFLLFATYWACLKEKIILLGVFIGLGYLTRGEFIFISIPITLHFAIIAYQQRQSIIELFFRLIKIAGFAAIVALLWHSYYFFTFHNFFPSTLSVKVAQGSSGHWTLFYQSILLFSAEVFNNVYFVILALIGIIWQPYLFMLTGLYVIAHTTVYALLKIPNYHWYYYDIFIIGNLFIFIGTARVLEFFRSLFKQLSSLNLLNKTESKFYMALYFISIPFLILFSLKVSIYSFVPSAPPYPIISSSLERYTSYLKASQFIKDNTPTETDIKPSLLTSEVGIIGNKLMEFEIRDINGLASPNTNVKQMNDWNYFVDKYQPDYIFFPDYDGNLNFYQFQDRYYVYEKVFTANPAANTYKAAVYKKSSLPNTASLNALQLLLQSATQRAETNYFFIGEEVAISAHPPFLSTLPINTDAKQIQLEIGYRRDLSHYQPQVLNSSNGTKITISSLTTEQVETKIFEQTIFPFQGKKFNPPMFLKLDIKPNTQYIKIQVDAIENNVAYDWVYISQLSIL